MHLVYVVYTISGTAKRVCYFYLQLNKYDPCNMHVISRKMGLGQVGLSALSLKFSWGCVEQQKP